MTAQGRTEWLVPHLWEGYVNDGARQVPTGYGNTVCSATGDGRHLPVLDLDVPARLEPSRTPGHSHLYLDVPMSWAQYSTLLHALTAAGVVEARHFVRALDSGATFVSPDTVPRRRRAAWHYAVCYAVLVVRACWRETRRRRPA